MGTSIHARALLVWLTITTWSARKYDRSISNKVNADNNAAANAGRWNKLLLPGDAASYKALVTLAGTIRAEHYSHTLAWSDEGWRLLPTANYSAYTDWLRQRQRDLDRAVRVFADDYPLMKTSAHSLLGASYKDEDYPAAVDLPKRFKLSRQLMPVPAGGDIRVDLGRDQILTIEQDVTAQVQAATQAAVNDAWSRLHDVTAKIAERLAVPDAIFRDTLITNAREVCDVLRRLNVTDDAKLESMRAKVDRELCRYDPDVLRDTKSVRQQTADKAAAILAQMSSVLGKAVA